MMPAEYDVHCCSLPSMVSVSRCSGRSWATAHADNLKCVTNDPEVLLSAAQFTAGYVRMVGQEPAPSQCVLMSTSKKIRLGNLVRPHSSPTTVREEDCKKKVLHVNQLGETQHNLPHHSKKEKQVRVRQVHLGDTAYVKMLKLTLTAREDQEHD